MMFPAIFVHSEPEGDWGGLLYTVFFALSAERLTSFGSFFDRSEAVSCADWHASMLAVPMLIGVYHD